MQGGSSGPELSAKRTERGAKELCKMCMIQES